MICGKVSAEICPHIDDALEWDNGNLALGAAAYVLITIGPALREVKKDSLTPAMY